MNLLIAQAMLAFFVLFLSGFFLRMWLVLAILLLAIIGTMNMLDYPSYPIMHLVYSSFDFISTVWSRSQFTIIAGIAGLLVGIAFKSSNKNNYKKR